jgi:hypothetical protein
LELLLDVAQRVHLGVELAVEAVGELVQTVLQVAVVLEQVPQGLLDVLAAAGGVLGVGEQDGEPLIEQLQQPQGLFELLAVGLGQFEQLVFPVFLGGVFELLEGVVDQGGEGGGSGDDGEGGLDDALGGLAVAFDEAEQTVFEAEGGGHERRLRLKDCETLGVL